MNWTPAVFKTRSSFQKHTRERQKICDTFTSCVCLWWCFLKNNISHFLFLSGRIRTCERSRLASSKISADKKRREKLCHWSSVFLLDKSGEWVKRVFFLFYFYTHTHTHTDWSVHMSVEGPGHWGGSCFLSVVGRDEVMINTGDVWRCKSVLQHK